MKRIQTPEQFADRLLTIEKLIPSYGEIEDALALRSKDFREKQADRLQSAIFAVAISRLEVKTNREFKDPPVEKEASSQ